MKSIRWVLNAPNEHSLDELNTQCVEVIFSELMQLNRLIKLS